MDKRGVKRKREADTVNHANKSPYELKKLAMPMLIELLCISPYKHHEGSVVQLKAARLPERVPVEHYTDRYFRPCMCFALSEDCKFSDFVLSMVSESLIGPGKEESAAHMLSVSWALSYRLDKHKHVIMPPSHEVSVSKQEVLSEVKKLSWYYSAIVNTFWPDYNSVVRLSVSHRYPLCDLQTLLRYPWELLPSELVYIDPKTGRQTLRQVDRYNIAGCLLEALQCLYMCNVVHTDIKPENCFAWYNDSKGIVDVCLGDFDSASVRNSSLPGFSYKATTCRFCPPECPGQHDQNRTDSKGDVWAMGCVLWQVIHSTPNPAFDCCTEHKVQRFKDTEDEPGCHRKARVLLQLGHLGKSCETLNAEALSLHIYSAQGYRPRNFPKPCSYLDALVRSYATRPAIIPEEYVDGMIALRDDARAKS